MPTRTPLALLATALACSLFAAPAHALRARVFVAKTGADAGGCSFSAPCQSLNFAYSAVLAGGEITIIDNAGYESLTINKALTITGPAGVEAGIAVPSGGTAIIIAAGPNDAVVLRGLTLNGGGVGTNGIVFNSGASLTVTGCVVQNFAGSGIKISPTTSSKIAVSNTIVADNSGDGITFRPPPSSGPTVSAVFNRVESYNNAAAGIAVLSDLMAAGGIDAMIIDSVAGYNDKGFYSAGNSGIFSFLQVFRSVAFDNGTAGVRADAYGRINVSQSNVEKNASPWSQTSTGLVASYGDNYSGAVAAPAGTISRD
jgi:hypothetical protein